MSDPLRTRGIGDPQERWWSDIASREAMTGSGLLASESHGGRYHRSVYDLFAEMEEKDGHLYSVLQTRINGLLGLERRIDCPQGMPEQQRAFLDEALAAIPRQDELLRALLDALAKGFSVVELHWRYREDGRLVIHNWTSHPQEFFAFDHDGRLLLRYPPFPTALDEENRPAPERKFLALRFSSDPRHSYGRGLCLQAYWPYWFKKNALRFWAVANEKHGAPTAIARYPEELSAEDRRSLRVAVEALQTDSGLVIPKSVDLSLLEANRADGLTFQRLIDWCNDEISKIVLGATLTSGEGRRSGSLALGTIHELVRQDYIEADARLLEHVVNDSLIRWLMEANFTGPRYRPRWRLVTESPQDLNAAIEVDRHLLSFGVPLSVDYFHRRYGRPKPADQEVILRYDDANFYQYHLQFGVLTINEVRRRLSLPPVPWGDKPTANPNPEIMSGKASSEDTGRAPR